MLGSAPGTDLLSEWVDALDSGMSLEDVANHIAASDAFKSTYPNYITNERFAEKFLGNLMGGEEVPAELMMAAVDIVEGLLNDGMTRGALALAVVGALFAIDAQGAAHPAHGDLGGVAALLANRIEVAEYYTLDAGHEYPSADVLANVTSDAASVAMAIRDVDSPPANAVFDEPGDLSIMENAASGDVGMVTASDPNDDADYPDPVSYSLKDAPAGFSIDAATGAISYMGDGLDHETTPTVPLHVVATSIGADGTSTDVGMMVTVNVGDVQESDAVFDPAGALSIDENEAMGDVGAVTATDAEDEAVTYRLADGSHAGFSIDSATGAISYAGDGLNHEATPTIDLEVIATSVGANNMPTDVSTTVTVMVGDVPESTAQFGPVPELTLEEHADGSDTPIGVGNITATDAEGDAITYSLKDAPAGWAILDDGKLCYIGTGIDYDGEDGTQSVDLTVVASSYGADGQTMEQVEQDVTVMITNLHDVELGETEGSQILLEKTSGMDEAIVVAKVPATDADGDEISYELKGFVVDSDNSALIHTGFAVNDMGEITYSGPGIKNSTSGSVDVTVVVSSRGDDGMTHSEERTVTIEVQPWADAEFGDVGALSLDEEADGSGMPGDDNAPIGVGTVAATDLNGDTITYTIKDAPEGWAILDDGKLCYIGSGIDADGENGVASVDLTIVATSLGANGEQTSVEQDVTVTVNALNDNAPELTVTGEFMLKEQADGSGDGNAITVGDMDAIMATDGDGDEVSITTDNADFVVMDGKLCYIGTGVDFDNMPSVDVVITASDGELTDTETVTVSIVDRSNAAFGDVSLSDLPENTDGSETPFVVGMVPATDADGDAVTYSIKDAPAGWTIGDDGTLSYVGTGIDFETQSSVDLTIVATSEGVMGEDVAVEQAVTVMIGDVPEDRDGETYTLTDDQDYVEDFTGTDRNDVFRAPSGTLTTADHIDGGGGNMDRLDVSYIDSNVEISTREITVENIEILDVRTTGNFGSGTGAEQLDFSSWNLREINMLLVGDDDTTDDSTLGEGPGTVGINAGGAAVWGRNLIGQVDIEGASTVDLDGVGNDDAVNIVSGTVTTSVAIKGGAAISIDSNGSDGQSSSVESVSIDGAAGAVDIDSDVITTLSLANTNQAVSVNNSAKSAVDIEVTVNQYGIPVAGPGGTPAVTAAALTLEGAGAAKTVGLVAAGASNVTLTSAAATTLNLSGDGDLTLALPAAVKDINATNAGALTIATITSTVESFDGAGATGAINLGIAGTPTGDAAGELTDITTGSGGDKLYINAGAKLKTINSNIGKDELSVTAGAALESIMAGEGDDTVTLQAGGALRTAGLAITLGGGNDTYVALNNGGANGTKTTVMGGSGEDTLQMADGSFSTVVDAASKSIYSGFEILDVTGGSGTYDMETLGLRRVVTKASGAVVLDDVAAGTTVRMDGVSGQTTTEANVTYVLKNATGNADRVTVTVVANGAATDTIDSDATADGNQMIETGEASLTFTANGIETVVINSEVNVHADSDAMASQYENSVTLTSDAAKTLDINGAAKVNVTATAAADITRVDATGNSGGVTVTVDTTATGTDIVDVDFDGGNGNDNFTGGAGADDFTGGGGDDMLTGGGGADVMYGGVGDDTLVGDAGIDLLIGGIGGDTLTGGGDRDIFRYQSSADSRVSYAANGSTQGIDTITDFTTSQNDVIRLSRNLATETDLAGGTNAVLVKDAIVGDGVAATNDLRAYLTANANGFFRQGPDNLKIATAASGADLYVFIDANNNGNFEAGSDLVILLTGVSAVTGDDFDII